MINQSDYNLFFADYDI